MQRAARSSHPGSGRWARSGAAGLVFCALLAGAVASASAQSAVTFQGQGVQLACTRPAVAELSCDYRLLAPGDPGVATARLGALDLPLPRLTPLGAEPGSSAVLVLVDASVADGFSTVAAASRDASVLAGELPERVHLGLASFAGELRVHAGLGSSAETFAAAARALDTEEGATELYRNTLEAVRMLGRRDAGRRALFLLSHGVADDQAYFHDDVVSAAREHGVAIFGVGYEASPEEAAALQRLRRLAEETGGLYVTASEDRPLDAVDATFASRALTLLESGGRLSVDLSSALERIGDAAEPLVIIGWGTSGSGISARVPLSELPLTGGAAGAPGSGRLVSTPPAERGAAGASPPVPPVHRDGALARHWPWLALVLVLLGAGGAAGYVHLKRRPAAPAPEPLLAETVKLSARSFAFLEAQDEERTRHPLTVELFRIGRHADNELPLTDPSLSRHHAEIRHELNGGFVIRDLESLNGVYVNGKKCRSAALGNGDLIELGDVSLKFTVFASHDRPGAESAEDSDGAQEASQSSREISRGTVTPFRPAGTRSKPRSS